MDYGCYGNVTAIVFTAVIAVEVMFTEGLKLCFWCITAVLQLYLQLLRLCYTVVLHRSYYGFTVMVFLFLQL